MKVFSLRKVIVLGRVIPWKDLRTRIIWRPWWLVSKKRDDGFGNWMEAELWMS